MSARCAPLSARWLELRVRLWPDSSPDELAREQEEFINDAHRFAVLFAVDERDSPIGFAEVSLREWAEGCRACPAGVGYIEAWYVEPEHRRRGAGAALLAAAEAWAARRGCREMGSDAEIWNDASIEAHRACGYEEVVRVVMLRKAIGGE